MAYLTCTVCGSSARKWTQHPDAVLYRCQCCGHCFTDQAALRTGELYDGAYFDETHSNWFKYPHKWLFEQLRTRITPLAPTPRVLDVGCGKGAFLRWLHTVEPTWRLTGIDLRPNEPEDGITFIQGDVLTQALAGTFDAVVSLAVIEHVCEPHLLAQLLSKHCSTNGRVFIMTLNDGSILYAAARSLRRLGLRSAFVRLYGTHHLNHFNVRSLKRLATTNGMDVVDSLMHNIPMQAVDVPSAAPAVRVIWRAGVWATFMMGHLTRRTYLQTITCRPRREALV